MSDADVLEALRFDERGLVAVVAQEEASGAVLMLAWANREAVERTLRSGRAWFWSRSRQRLWEKGESSGHHLAVVAAAADCDGDALLLRVRSAGPACHTGARTCFEPNPATLELGWLAEVIAERAAARPGTSYTARLLAAGAARVAQKVGEEATEVVVSALASGEEGSAERLAGEAADLLYHLLVLLHLRGVEPLAVARELARRQAAGSGAPEAAP